LQESLQQLPETDKWAAKDVVSLDDGHSIALEIISGTAIGVSDGSYKDSFGTSAFIFEGVHSEGCITGRNCIPGAPEDQSAHRSEVGGIVGMAVTLKALCKLYDITTGSVTLGLDGKLALNSAFLGMGPTLSETRLRHPLGSKETTGSPPNRCHLSMG
jgi:hypothetical protein